MRLPPKSPLKLSDCSRQNRAYRKRFEHTYLTKSATASGTQGISPRPCSAMTRRWNAGVEMSRIEIREWFCAIERLCFVGCIATQKHVRFSLRFAHLHTI